MVYCFESCKLIIYMPTVYVKQLKQYTQKGGIRRQRRTLYGQVRKLSPIYSLINFLTLHIHFKYVLTNFVTLYPICPRMAGCTRCNIMR
jgi:hypothetical protein